MPRRVNSKQFPKLSWHEPTGRWRKRYKGETFYHPGRPTKRASYPEAVHALERWKLKIDKEKHEEQSAKAAYACVIGEYESRMAAFVSAHADTPEARAAYREFDKARQCAIREAERHSNDTGDKAQLNAGYLRDSLWHEAGKIMERYEPATKAYAEKWNSLASTPMYTPPAGPAPWDGDFKQTVDDLDQLVAAFINHKMADAQAGEVTTVRVKRIEADLKAFISFAGGASPLEDINSSALDGYRESVRSSELSPHSKRDRLASVKQMIKWAHRREYLDSMPRTLQSSWSIKVQSKAVQIVADLDLERFHSESKPQLQLYTLLTLNCGMTQNDMADLKPSEVDWERG